MCQSTAYIIKGESIEEYLTDVATIVPEGAKLRLINLFGEEKVIEAEIAEIDLLEHKILLKPRG